MGDSPREWRVVSDLIIQRDDFRCQECSAQLSEGLALSVHHIVPRDEGGATVYSNLITLCDKCHDEIECAPELATFRHPSKKLDEEFAFLVSYILDQDEDFLPMYVLESRFKSKKVHVAKKPVKYKICPLCDNKFYGDVCRKCSPKTLKSYPPSRHPISPFVIILKGGK